MATYRVAIIVTGPLGYQLSSPDLTDHHAAARLQHPPRQPVAGVHRRRDNRDNRRRDYCEPQTVSFDETFPPTLRAMRWWRRIAA